MYSAPVEIEIERLFLLAVPNTDIVYNSEKEERWAREAKQAELTRVEEQKQKQREAASKLIINIFLLLKSRLILVFYRSKANQ